MVNVSISVETNINRVLPQIKQTMSVKNFRFALAKTLSNLAQESQAQVRREMPRRFNIRRPWVVNGVRIKTATPRTLEASVYSLDSGGRRAFMTKQEFGGVKTPDGGKHIAIPLKTIRPNPKSIIPQYMKPKSLLMQGPQKNKTAQRMVSKAMPFKIKGKKPGHEWIMIARGTKTGKNGKTYRLYVPGWLLAPRATIKPTDFLIKPTRDVVKARGDILLYKNIIEALKPRR